MIELAYGESPLQRFNLYDHPPGAPCVLFIHGGGWQRGDKDRMTLALQHHANRLVDRYTVLSMNYRLAPETRFPGQPDDARSMLEWIAGHAPEWNAGTDCVVFAESSGASLGALRAVSGAHPGVRGYIGFAGVYDLTVENDSTALGQLVATYLGCEPQDCPQTAREASPSRNVIAPLPALLVHGTADPVVGTYQSVLFAAALGPPHFELLFLPGGGHTGPAFQTPEVDAAVDALLSRALPV